MPPLSSYTPFESLLFFQSLATCNTRPVSFAAISELLKANPFVRQDVTFDPKRLDPQALEDLYTKLVTEGLESRSSANSTPGNQSPNPKKRKVAVPPLQDVGSQHSTIVPDLVPRLYAAYKERVTQEIRQEEQRYREIKEEIAKLEISSQEPSSVAQEAPAAAQHVSVPDRKADEPSAPEEQIQPTAPTPPKAPVSSSAVKAHQSIQQKPITEISAPDKKSDEPRAPEEQVQLAAPAPPKAPAPPTQAAPEAVRHVQAPDRKSDESHVPEEQLKPTAPVPPNASSSSNGVQTQQPIQQKPISGIPAPDRKSHEPRAPEEQVQPTAPVPLKAPTSSSAVKTQQPIQQKPITAAAPAQKPSGGTKAQQNANPQFIMEQGFVNQPQSQPARNGYQQIHPKTEPKIQPAPTKPTNVPIPPYRQAAQFPNPSFSSAGPTPSFPSVPASQPHIKPAPAPATSPPVINHQQAPQGSPVPQGTPGAHPQHAWYPHPPTQSPAYGHISPYANAPYPNNHIPGGQFPPVPPNHYGHVSPPANFQVPYQIPGQQGHPVPNQRAFAQQQAAPQAAPPAKPAVGPVGNIKVEIPSFSKSLAQRRPISRTPWKLPDPITIPQRPGSPVPPRPEDISPISDRAPSPGFQVPPDEKGLGRGLKHAEQSAHDFDNPPAAGTRSRKTTPARGRGRGTALSPSIAHSTRSRSRGFSVTSRDEDTDATTVQTRIKKEIPSTPAGISDDVEYKTGLKRKRISSGFISEDGQLSTGHATQYVRCSQNFGRISGPILNNVSTHKYASIFAKPLTEREVPGYRNLIYRPQDIKSIKSAIHQGSKAISAATEAGEAETPGPASGPTNTLIIKKTVDLVPPKAIVNSSQLEKELIRMFANAVMFNPTSENTFGPEFPMRTETRSREGTQNSELEEGGIISDTLAMYEDVEKAVSTWRSVERGAGDMGNGGGHLSLRRGSTSDINMDGAADEGK